MNKDLILAIEALEKENGISKEIMFDAIEKSLMDEYKAELMNRESVAKERVMRDVYAAKGVLLVYLKSVAVVHTKNSEYLWIVRIREIIRILREM